MSLVDFLTTPLGETFKRAEGRSTWCLVDAWLSRELDEAQKLPPILVMLIVGLLAMFNPRALLNPEVWVGVAVFGGFPAVILWGLEKLRSSFRRAPFVSLIVLVFVAMMAATWPAEAFYGASGIGFLLALRTIGKDLLCVSSSAATRASHLIGDLIIVSKPSPGADKPWPVAQAATEHRTGAQRGLIRYVEGGADEDENAEGRHGYRVETLNRDGPQPAGAKVGWHETFFKHVNAAGAAWEVNL